MRKTSLGRDICWDMCQVSHSKESFGVVMKLNNSKKNVSFFHMCQDNWNPLCSKISIYDVRSCELKV